MRPLDPRIPSAVAELVCREVIDLTGVSTFFRRQAECAAQFTEGIEQRAPGCFVLKSPFRENFVGSLPVYIFPNLGAAETIAYTLPRHAAWYLRTRDVDRIRRRFAAELTEGRTLQPIALKPGTIQWWEGFIAADGEFAINAEKQGTPGILAFQEISGDNTSLALEIRGPDVGRQDPAFRKTLLKSALKAALLRLGLEQPRRGRRHDDQRAEKIAHARDHKRLKNLNIARQFCDCGQQRHAGRCFDRLNAVADSFYSVQRSHFEKLVKSQARINS